MGRYTSMQGFSDQNTKMVAGTESNNSGESANQNSTANSNAGSVGHNKLIVDKVQFTQGSCAGAGSGEFDKYRAARNRELQRLKDIELRDKAIVEEQLYQAKINNNTRESEERTNKNRQKRDKKKLKLLKKKELKKLHKDDDNYHIDDSADEHDDKQSITNDHEDGDDESHDAKKQKTT